MIAETGIGILYLPGLENLIESFSTKLDVIELEPQTTWYKKSLEEDSFRFDRPTADWLRSMHKPIVFHGVGFPIGGTLKSGPAHFHSLNDHINFLNPVYVSEHLSFNRFTNRKGNISQVSFLLPVVQNNRGISTAVEHINHYKQNIKIPFAFETGVNYFKPVNGELPDGFFFREVAERSDSKILLDIHNVLTNEINGRQTVTDLLKTLPLDRVIEIHLGGGEYYNDYYLDSHSNISSNDLLDLTYKIVQSLPNLKTIIFEMIPEYYGRTITDDMIDEQIRRMRKIWDARGKKCGSKSKTFSQTHSRQLTSSSQVESAPGPATNTPGFRVDEFTDPAEWERSLGELLNSDIAFENKITAVLSSDKGLQIVKDLVFQFRASSVISALKITCRYIRLTIGSDKLTSLLREFCQENPPQIFGLANAESFAKFLKDKNLNLEFIGEIIAFELAAMHSAVDGIKRIVNLPFEPFSFLDALVKNKKPQWQVYPGIVYETELTNDLSSSNSLMKLEPVFHN